MNERVDAIKAEILSYAKPIIWPTMADQVGRQVNGANMERDRLVDLAQMSGAKSGEFGIAWRYSRAYGGLWPFLE